jgi:hypothetical protein
MKASASDPSTALVASGRWDAVPPGVRGDDDVDEAPGAVHHGQP